MILNPSHLPTSHYLSEHRSATVVGLGVTGYSVVRYLVAHGLTVAVTDSRDKPPMATRLSQEFPHVRTHFGDLDNQATQDAELLIVSPGVNRRQSAIQAAKAGGAVVVGDVELFLAHNTAPVIAITGSNGKSTVTTLVGKLCEANQRKALVAGNIGKPVLDALTDEEHYEIAVLELSSFQLETTQQVPAESATILNISQDHMDRYDSMGDYVLAKARILRGAKRAVLPRQEPQLAQITNASDTLTFGLDQPSSESEFGVISRKSGRWLAKGSLPLMPLKEVPLVGLHNVSNVLAAFALVNFLDFPVDALRATVQEFHGLPHRMQTVVQAAGVKWVNDSKATNVGATSSALNSIETPIVWLAGGESKDADFTPLSRSMTNVRRAILFGKDAKQIQAALGATVSIDLVQSLEEAVQQAKLYAQEGDIVLLSPACASFDMFDNFEHRGQVFANAARQCAKQSGGER